MQVEKDRLSATDAAVVVVGIVFGSGIFVAPQPVAAFCGSLWASVLVWPLAAAVAVCGSMSYAECISRVAGEGGFYTVFRHTFGERFATAAGLLSQLVISPVALAGPVLIGGNAVATSLAAWLPAGPSAPWVARTATLSLLFAAALFNALGVHFSKVAQRVFVAAKVLLVVGLVLACLLSHAGVGAAVPGSVAGGLGAVAGRATLPAMVACFSMLLWTFDGWTDVTMIAPRLRRPGADLSRALVLGLFGLAAIFMMVQYAVMHILGPLGTATAEQPFRAAIETIFGPISRWVVDGAIVLSTFTSAHGVLWMVSSLTHILSQQGTLPRWLAATDTRLARPICCVGFVTLLATVACTSGSFTDVMETFTFFIWIFYGLMVLSLWRLRRRQVAAPGTWVAPAGPLPLWVVGGAALLMTGLHLWEHPMGSLLALLGFGLLLALVPSRAPKDGAASTQA